MNYRLLRDIISGWKGLGTQNLLRWFAVGSSLIPFDKLDAIEAFNQNNNVREYAAVQRDLIEWSAGVSGTQK